MAPLGPEPAMVSNDRSCKAPVASRKPSSRTTASISSGRSWPTAWRRSSQHRKRARAAPSRMWAWRAPSTSVEFLRARGKAVGSGPQITWARAPSSRSKYQAEETAGSISTARPLRAARAAGKLSGASKVTSSPSQASRPAVCLAGSRNSRARPSSSRIAWLNGRGERITSPPRMLNSQAMEVGAVITAASAPRALSPWLSRARLSAETSPENSSGWATTGA